MLSLHCSLHSALKPPMTSHGPHPFCTHVAGQHAGSCLPYHLDPVCKKRLAPLFVRKSLLPPPPIPALQSNGHVQSRNDGWPWDLCGWAWGVSFSRQKLGVQGGPRLRHCGEGDGPVVAAETPRTALHLGTLRGGLLPLVQDQTLGPQECLQVARSPPSAGGSTGRRGWRAVGRRRSTR